MARVPHLAHQAISNGKQALHVSCIRMIINRSTCIKYVMFAIWIIWNLKWLTVRKRLLTPAYGRLRGVLIGLNPGATNDLRSPNLIFCKIKVDGPGLKWNCSQGPLAKVQSWSAPDPCSILCTDTINYYLINYSLLIFWKLKFRMHLCK